jgi:dienelactone hydrolase
LLLFNPAWGGQRTQNAYMVEELASHGFIVVAIDHTHNSIPIAFPGGQVLNLSDPQGVHDPVTSVLQEQIAYYDHELKQQTDDDLFVLDQILKQNSDPDNPWFGTIDTARIGALGHSFGGAVAVEAAFRDARIRAALNLDGWNFGELGNAPLGKPLMLMYEDSAPPTQAFRVPHDPAIVRVPLDSWDAQNVQRTLTESGGYMLSIRGASHFNYTDRGLYSPVRKLTEAGPIKPERVHAIANRYALAFFSEALNGEQEPILHQAGSPYAEVTFEEWKAGQP